MKSLTIDIIKRPYDIEIFSYSTLTISPGITVFVGCNGAGKSSLLKNIEKVCKKKDISYVMFDSKKESPSDTLQHILNYGTSSHFNFASCTNSLMFRSEGETLRENIALRCMRKIGYLVSNSQNDDVVILLDAIDSGLSIDHVVELKDFIHTHILEDIEKCGKDGYIIMSANTYEMTYGERCIDVQTGQEIRFDSYDDYKDFILKSKEIKTKLYNQTTHDEEDD